MITKKWYLLFSIAFSITIFEANGQVEKYFVPSDKYFYNTFQYYSPQCELKETIDYSYDEGLLVNFKKIIIPNSSYSAEVATLYSVSPNNIIKKSVTNNLGLENQYNSPVIKIPPSIWSYKISEKEIEKYTSKYINLNTEYGEYPDCILITKTTYFNNKIAVEINYYSLNLGLVKSITKYGSSESVKTLKDDFSEYSIIK